MSKPLDILFVASEVEPFAKTGSIAEVAAALPKLVKSMGHEIRVMLPGYGFINERRNHLHRLLRMKDIPIPMGSGSELAYVKSSYLATDNKKVQVYFVSNDKFFNRVGLYSHPETKQYFPDNDERFIFFCRGILETLKRLGWQPKIIHCNDWQCGLIPVYLKTLYKNDPYFKNVKTIFTAYNLAYHGSFPSTSVEKTGLPSSIFTTNGSKTGKLDFLRAGLEYADVITTVGAKADKKFSTEESLMDLFKQQKKSIISLTSPMANGSKHEQLAEKFVSIYSDLAKMPK
ncbi:MAG: glycogen/starch synthase [Ignavibacteriae bacterium]|nr:glycogen/starch synthase [Ignavibacteriota bacterium]